MEWQCALNTNFNKEIVLTNLWGKRTHVGILDSRKTFDWLAYVERKIGYFDHGVLCSFSDDAQRFLFGDRSFSIPEYC